ncbi:MAG: hypothetical protein DRO67_07490 [Candidatus Asgardarchaeum californiense]|nr:MAG: hypothetical protein DRO67_07490 [Candidatus Asgardarchaeum californiense]
MIEIKGNLFNEPCDAFCITTNGFVKKDGTCVMGRGCAKQASNYWPQLPKIVGQNISDFGNVVFAALNLSDGRYLLSFPVKPVSVIFNGNNCVKHMMNKFNIGDTVPGWAAVADIELIKSSAKNLVIITNTCKWNKVVLPRPGCGAGELSWLEVKQELDQILDDRFYSITF